MTERAAISGGLGPGASAIGDGGAANDRVPPSDRDTNPVEIDATVAHAARMYDYLLGGTTNFAVDREAVERASLAVGGIENARADVRANRAFLGRVVHYLAAEAGLRQFLDLGTGIPHGDGTGAIARRVSPDSRIVYVDNDPVVLAHAHSLLCSTPAGATAYVHGDLRDPETILHKAAATLDFSRPIAVVLVAVLHLIGDEDDPYGIVARVTDAVPDGSYLAVSHLTPDIQPKAMAELARRLNDASKETFVMRNRGQVWRFLDGLEIIEPGVVQLDEWRPNQTQPVPSVGWVPSLYGALGRKS